MTTGQATDPLIGRLVDGRYRVRARIARGGMATVYVATDLRLERRVALKVMHGHLTDDSLFESRFIQEARQAARLADPHVVNVFDQGRDGDMAYLVMEYLPGITLRDLMREQRRLSVPQTITIMDAILSGLAAAHRAGIVHRDVKPENVLLAEDGRIKIGDFGLARATTANTASGALLMGTIAYLAPELVTRGTADARSDIYSLGIVLYEMLVGEQPYKGEQPMQIAFQHATDSVPRPSVRNPAVPEQLDELVLWATERETADRPADAGELLARLREIEDQLGIRPRVTRPTSTRIAPLGSDPGDSGAVTKVLPGVFTAPTVTHDVDSATRLRRRTRRDASKGAWLLVLVLLLAALAGGAGWWFGSGPGSLVAVPDVTGAAGYDEAAGVLSGLGFAPSSADAYSIDVPQGGVVDTDPAAGSRLDKGAAVTVLVSQGPAPHRIQALSGMSSTQARGILADDARLRVGDDDRVFSDAAADTVIGATVTPRGGGDAFACGDGCTVHEGDAAVLQVSAGAVPDVAGLGISDATQRLQAAGLVVASDYAKQFSDTVDEGRVIALAPTDGDAPRRPGDTVTLVVSQGPELFAVPDVVGDTLSQARKKITDAGFEISYDPRWDSFPDLFTVVQSQSPGAQSQKPAGTTVSVVIRASL